MAWYEILPENLPVRISLFFTQQKYKNKRDFSEIQLTKTILKWKSNDLYLMVNPPLSGSTDQNMVKREFGLHTSNLKWHRVTFKKKKLWKKLDHIYSIE